MMTTSKKAGHKRSEIHKIVLALENNRYNHSRREQDPFGDYIVVAGHMKAGSVPLVGRLNRTKWHHTECVHGRASLLCTFTLHVIPSQCANTGSSITGGDEITHMASKRSNDLVFSRRTPADLLEAVVLSLAFPWL